MILPIYLYGNPILRKDSVDIDKSYPDLEQLINNMFETMYNAQGVGLAAPQVGQNINLIVIDTQKVEFEGETGLSDFKRVLINPKLTFNTEAKIGIDEGCLSIPNIHEKVNRIESITLEYLNENFEPVTEHLKGYKAIVVQHEFDHLRGVLFVDKISSIRKRFLKNRLLNISKGKVVADYKVKN